LIIKQYVKKHDIIIISKKMSAMNANQILAAKRLQGELKQLEKNREEYYHVIQDEKDQHTFYFLIRGDASTPYKGGYYIGKIALPKDYPTTPGDFYMLTPSGRFNVNAKICLTNSGYHKESWTPMWNINNMVVAFVSIFSSDDTTGISHIKETPSERKNKAVASVKYNMDHHKDIWLRFTQFVKPDGTVRTDDEVKAWIQENAPKKANKKVVGAKADDKMVKVVKAGTKVEAKADAKASPKKESPKKESPKKESPKKASPKKADSKDKEPKKANSKDSNKDAVKAEAKVDDKADAKQGNTAKAPVKKDDDKKVVAKAPVKKEAEKKASHKVEAKASSKDSSKDSSKGSDKESIKSTSKVDKADKTVKAVKPIKIAKSASKDANVKEEESDDVEGGMEETPKVANGTANAKKQVDEGANSAGEEEVITIGKKSEKDASKTKPVAEPKVEPKVNAKSSKKQPQSAEPAPEKNADTKSNSKSDSKTETKKVVKADTKAQPEAEQVKVASKKVVKADKQEPVVQDAKAGAKTEVKTGTKVEVKAPEPVQVKVSVAEAREAQRKETLKIVSKNKQLPQNYQEWRKMIDRTTLQTYDQKLFRMMF
ncbi:ubiquitin-conjugating enzyme E2, partial [Yasminevirus sp. GU-2018]